MHKNLHKHCLGALALLGAVAQAHADRALVIGIDQYPKLDADEQLRGCVADSQSMAALLKARGFTVMGVANGQATHDGILKAIAQFKASASAGERVVFYYAGHGSTTSAGKASLVPNDGSASTDSQDITGDALNAMIMAIPAKSRTVILDSCYSGGMTRGLSIKARKSRGLVRPYFGKLASRDGGGSKKIVIKPDGSDVVGSGKVCYFTACRNNEVANEMKFDDGSRHGCFTYALAKRMEAEPNTWGDVQLDVSKAVSEFTEELQHPTLTSAYADKKPFDGSGDPEPPKPDPGPGPKPNSIWDAYNADHADPAVLSVSVTPNRSSFSTKEKFKLNVKTGGAGYLVVLERDTDQNINLVFPAESDAVGMTEAGGTITLPGAGKSYEFDKSGDERVKAILFRDEAAAKGLVDAFRAKGGSVGVKDARKMQRVNDDPNPAPLHDFTTSDVIFDATAGASPGSSPSASASRPMRFARPQKAAVSSVFVETLRDRGGASAAGEGGPLNERLTQALATFLTEGANGSVRVLTAPADASSDFRIEGDLSEQRPVGKNDGPYMLVLRLHRKDGEGDRVIGQIAGTATTLRDLTNNWHRDPRYDARGLVGEMSQRILRALPSGGEADAEVVAWLEGIVRPDAAKVRLLRETDALDTSQPARYRLSVTGAASGEVYVLVRGKVGLSPALVPGEGRELRLLAGQPRLLPDTAQALDLGSHEPTDLYVLIRQPRTGVPSAPPSYSVAPSSDLGTYAVELLSTLPTGPAMDADLQRLLTMSKADPKGTWQAVRVGLPAL